MRGLDDDDNEEKATPDTESVEPPLTVRASVVMGR